MGSQFWGEVGDQGLLLSYIPQIRPGHLPGPGLAAGACSSMEQGQTGAPLIEVSIWQRRQRGAVPG